MICIKMDIVCLVCSRVCLAPSDYHLFRTLRQHLRIDTSMIAIFQVTGVLILEGRILDLPIRWEKIVDMKEDCGLKMYIS